MADVNVLWDNCLKVIKDNVSEEAYKTWFKPVVPLKYENNEFIVEVPSMFFYEYIEEKFAELLRLTISREVGENTRLLYRILVDRSSQATTDVPAAVVNNHEKPSQTILNVIESSPFKKVIRQDVDPQLNTSYNFNTFVEGNSNKLARTAGISIANEPGKTIFNPLFLYGCSGVGKTHLVNAIGVMAKQLNPDKRVLYVTANLFKIQYTDSVRNNTQNDFLSFYQSIDVLIIDDIQEFMTTGVQNTFFHIFNHLHQMGKQLILTSDRAPGMLAGMEERLLTRFKWGLTAEIEKPDFELRKAILKQKIYKDGLDISEDVIDYIAENVSDNIRNLEGVLISLLAHATLTDTNIDVKLAQSVIGTVVSAVPNKVVSVEKIRDVVCEYYAISTDKLMSSSRKREISTARQVAMYLSKQYTKNSLSSIGKIIGNRNHATVLHACSVVNDLIDTDKNIRFDLQELEDKLKS
ncbi:MAG: chromosomal replication initiator protein DnaA [Sphingobacteriia bacterium]|jgi:chromosomal replication initiator protein|nr:chromosomal replication initiator protein DnaA [Paludibacteraceae bacterium]NCA78620.1 chromosomal replication initiator protein DnaA [Sphingobacteriia bacterium]